MAQLGLKERFFLICWKNWKAAWVYRYILLLAILTPSFFVSILVAIRNFNKVQRYDAKIYQPINLTAEWKKFTQRIAVIHDKLAEKGLHLHNCFVPQLIVGYAPKNSVFRDLMMRASVNYLDNITLIGFESDEALRMAMEKEHFLAGVSFNGDKNEESEEKLKGFYSLSVAGELFNLEYSLIFPSELRFFADSFIGQSWRTNTLVFPYSELEIKSSTESTNYVREGFISLQNAVSMSYIHTIGIMGNVPEVKLNQFPRRTHIFDPMLSHLAFILPFLIAIGYMCLLLIFSIRLVTQKLYRRKKILHVLGIDRRIHTFTWLVAGNVLLVVPVICVLFSIKIGVVDGYSLCSQSSWSALLFFLLCYNISSVCFCFMASSLVKTVPNAMILVGVLWILSFLPYMTSSTEYPLGKAKQLVSALCANTVFGYGFEKIVEFERKEVGLQWSNFFEFHKSDRVASVGVQCVLLICLSISYTALGLILYKLPVVCKKIYKEAKNKLLDVRPHREHMSDHVRTSNSMLNFRKTKVLEVQNEDKKVLIEVKNLTKKYHDKVVINSLSFNIYEGEVTVVMGHNGCGKTTLLTMIAGITHPTSGSIESNEVSLTLIFEFELRIGIGVPYMLHPELTVAEQIILYSRLRGLDMNKAQEEVEKYTQALNLENVTGVLTYKLSNCLQQCLTVCCSLCGNSTLVVLDEPSSGVDLTCKRKIWDLIIKEKMKRTIIISTHSAQEAEILGDHLLVLSGGEIMCYGSMFFMKSIYGKGYRLICHKTPYCDTGNVTMFLRNYIPQISPEADIGMELSYRLQERYFVVFNKLLADLEESFQKLEIKGCSISEPIVEDIVLLMGSEDSTESELFRQSDVMQGHTIYAEEYKKYSFMEDFDIYTGLKLFIIHLHAILLKNLHSNSHKEKVLLFICLPASVTFLTYIMSDPTLDRVPLHPITFRITQYAESVTPISGNLFDFDQKVYNLFLDYFTDLPSMSVVHKLEIIRSSNFTEAILEKEDSQKGFNEKYLVGASFERNEPIAWYNNYWLHTAPLSLNLLHNGILSALHHSGRITVIHDPLPLRTLEDLPDLRTMTHIGNLLALMLSYLISFIYSYGLFFSINEKAMRFKLTQFIFGIRHAELYIGAFVYDLAKIIIISLSVLLISLLYRDNIPDQNRSALFCFLIMIVFGICITPYYYLVSLMLKDATPGYWFVCFHNVFGVSCFMALLETIDSHQITELEMSTTSEWLSYLLPHFILCKALTKVFSIGKARFICQNEDVRTISLVLDGCKTAPNCCIEPKEFEWRYWGILPEIKYFLILGSVATILLCICELHVYWKRLLCFTIPQDNYELALEEYKRSHDERFQYQSDIIHERTRVEKLKEYEYQMKPLVVSNVSKKFGKKFAVSRVTLAMERGECFGLLGANDSGKTTLIRLLVGELNITSGRAYVHGVSVLDDILRVYELIGYCPNCHSFPSHMTCHQILHFFCQLRGIPPNLNEEICLSFAKLFGIMKNFDKQFSYTSPGVRRRLGTAISFIGNPHIIFLDSLTVGIDPAEHDPVISERYCTRVGIISNGNLLCVDYVGQLQTRYAKAYCLHLKVKSSLRSEENTSKLTISHHRLSLSHNILKIISYIDDAFPDATLIYHHGTSLCFIIPSKNTSLSQIFKKIKRKTVTFYVETFSVHWETLPLLMDDLVKREDIHNDK